MGKGVILVAVAATLAVAAPSASADRSPDGSKNDGKTVRCTGTVLPDFNPGIVTGPVDNVIVPANNFCILEGAQVKHDVLVGANGGLGAENSSVGHDIVAIQPWEIETGNNGPLTVGHDFVISGPDAENGAQGYDICDTSVGHDLKITGTSVLYEIEVGDIGPQNNEFCTTSPSPPVWVGHDLVVTGNSAGKIDIGNNTVVHDLVVKDNTLRSDYPLVSGIGVDDNKVGHDATCLNSVPLSKDGPEDGPNVVGGRNRGC
jgi:hypothetical protein